MTQKNVNPWLWLFVAAGVMLTAILFITSFPSMQQQRLVWLLIWGVSFGRGCFSMRGIKEKQDKYIKEKQRAQDSQEYWDAVKQCVALYKPEKMKADRVDELRLRLSSMIGDSQKADQLIMANHHRFPQESPAWCVVKSIHDVQWRQRKQKRDRK